MENIYFMFIHTHIEYADGHHKNPINLIACIVIARCMVVEDKVGCEDYAITFGNTLGQSPYPLWWCLNIPIGLQ